MSKKLQLNDMELNQVAGGGWTEFWQKVKQILTAPGPLAPVFPKPEPRPEPIAPKPMPWRDPPLSPFSK